MKKLITIILVLAVLLPVSALALDREVDPFYGYAHMEVSASGVPFMTVIYFAENKVCYFLTQMFFSDKPGTGRAYIGTWEYTSDGDVFAKVGDNVSKTFKITSLGSLVDRNTMEVYEEFSALMK